MWTTERLIDFRQSEASLEIQQRMHRDLLALQGLTDQLPGIMGARVVVDKGYAVDAACRQRLTRTHYDTDLVLATPYADQPAELYGAVGEVLARATGLEWVPTAQKRSSWVKFHEAGKRQWDNGVSGTARDEELAHQMDLHFVQASEPFAQEHSIVFQPMPGVEYKKPVEQAVIRDTFGNKFGFTIPTVSDMLATKLRLGPAFTELYGHHKRESDWHDFGLLFRHPDFCLDNFLELLADYYINKQGLSERQALQVVRAELEPVKHLAPAELIERLGD